MVMSQLFSLIGKKKERPKKKKKRIFWKLMKKTDNESQYTFLIRKQKDKQILLK